MRKVGLFGYNDENTVFYIDQSNNRKFYTDDKSILTADYDDLQYWAEAINSPWSQDHEKYTIKYNCKDSYTKMEESEPQFICIYDIVGFEGLYSEVIGYGDTVEDALKDCKDLFQYLQDNFNKENISF